MSRRTLIGVPFFQERVSDEHLSLVQFGSQKERSIIKLSTETCTTNTRPSDEHIRTYFGVAEVQPLIQ